VPDTAAAAFLQGVELAAIAAYAPAALVVGSPAAVRAVEAFVAHHRAHARGFATLAGNDALLAAPAGLTSALSASSPIASERDALAFLHSVESRVAATQQYVLASLVTVPAITLTAAVVPVECQHAAVFGGLLSLPLADVAPAVQGTAGHLVPGDYPLP
jgi:hypothetical protein